MAEPFFDPTQPQGLETRKLRSDNPVEAKDKSTPPNEHLERVSPGAISPHVLIFSIRDRKTQEPLVSWSILYPTFHAAQSEANFLSKEMKKLRGLNPWSEIARLTKCKAPQLLARHQNLHMDIKPKQPERRINVTRTTEVLRGKPKPTTFRDIAAAGDSGPHLIPDLESLVAQYLLSRGLVAVPVGGSSPDNQLQARSSPNRRRPGSRKRSLPPAKKRVPSGGASRKGAKKKSRPAKRPAKSLQRRPSRRPSRKPRA